MSSEEDIADFYHDETGADALVEFEALHRAHPRSCGHLFGKMSHVSGEVVRTGAATHYHAEAWGQLYLVTADKPVAYMFFRFAMNAPTRLVVIMVGKGAVGRAVEVRAMARFLNSKDL